MSRRPTAERLETARREATRNRLIADRMTAETADAWIAAWAAKAAEDGIERGAAYWNAAWEWIDERRQNRQGRG